MSINFNKPIQKYKSKEGKKKFSLFLACLLCSFIFWGFIKLSQENLVEVRYKVRTGSVPEDIFISAMQKPAVNIKFSSTGARLLLSGMLKKTGIVNVDFSHLTKSGSTDSASYFITSESIKRILLSDAGQNLDIVAVRPDTLFFLAQKAVERKVPVHVNKADIVLPQGYKIYNEIKSEPDSVIIKVPKESADIINKAHVDVSGIGKLEQSIERRFSLSLKEDLDNYTINPKIVKLSIPVEKYTEKSLEVKISVVCENVYYSIEEYSELRLMPSKTIINCLVALKDYHELSAEMFVVGVECEDFITDDKESKLQLRLYEYPDNVIINSVSPEQVDYILLK